MFIFLETSGFITVTTVVAAGISDSMVLNAAPLGQLRVHSTWHLAKTR